MPIQTVLFLVIAILVGTLFLAVGRAAFQYLGGASGTPGVKARRVAGGGALLLVALFCLYGGWSAIEVAPPVRYYWQAGYALAGAAALAGALRQASRWKSP